MAERLKDGHKTLIAFANYPSVKFWEKTVTPPGMDGGGENDTTTMHNDIWRTRQPKKLITLSPCSFSASYDPEVYDSVLDMLNENQLITITFPDGSSLAFWGWLNTFTPGECVEGEQPLADCQIIPSNEDDAGEETDPVYSAT